MDARTSRRELTKIQNRETILAAGRRVFAEMGFAAVTVRDIIRATPLAAGTFYNYFKSKEDVYQALRDEAALAIRPSLRAARRNASSAEEFLAAGFRIFFGFVAQTRGGPAPADAGRFRMDSPEVLAGFAELREDIEDAIARGLLPALDPGRLTAALTGIAFELAGQVQGEGDAEDLSRFATSLLLGGIGALREPDAG
ncbi:MAG TPA: TetR/AcrR family transcriptional regulator [Rhizomicrobium sp.]|jgi:AcrR family transcriptional regulator|nr:TetR/AcrR family transcriptional regulator [Rhizomicrobium sp.]